MGTVHVWPRELPDQLTELWVELEKAMGDGTACAVTPPGDLAASAGDAAVLVVDAWVANEGTSVVDGIATIADACQMPVVFVVGDGYIGTDKPSIATLVGSSAVSSARSMAAKREGHVRANVVAIPANAFGYDGEQRGPLNAPVDVWDIAQAIAFLAGEKGGYLSGQVLFVDRGRHLFSSQTA